MVRDERARLLLRRRAREDRPRLRLAEDRARADLRSVLLEPARVPALARPSPAHRLQQLLATSAHRAGELAVAELVGQVREPRIDVRELRAHEQRLGHLKEDGAEVRPVAVRPREIAAVRAAEALLMLVCELHVIPHARWRALVVERDRLVEERRSRARRGRTRRPRGRSRVEVARRAQVHARQRRPIPYGRLPLLRWTPIV